MNKLLNSLVVCALIAMSVSVFSNIPTAEAAFGVSPPWVNNNNLLPGSTFEQVVYLSRNETEEAMRATIRISGDEELAEWITISDEDNLIIKEGQNFLPMNVIVNVPEDAEIKDYTGGIFVTLSSVVTDTSLEGGEVAIGLGARISVNLSVIEDEVTDYAIKSVSAEPQTSDDSFSINVEVENKGNTEISDLEGKIDIYNSANTEIVKSLTFSTLNESVSSDQTKKVEMIFEDFKPEAGEYWVAVQAFDGEEVIYENRFLKKVKIEVAPVIIPEDTSAETGKISLIFGLAGLGVGLLVIIGILVVLILKRRAKNHL